MDASQKARLGLATGLKKTFFDGLEVIAVDWLGGEENEPVKYAILDHMAVNSEKSPTYFDAVEDAYIQAPPNSILRARLEADAGGLPLYGALRKIAIEGETLSLFGSEIIRRGAINVTQNINAQNIGNIAAGNISAGGDIKNVQSVATATEALDKLVEILKADKSAKAQEGIKLVQEAKAGAVHSKVNSVIEWMKTIKDGASLAAATTPAFAEILESLQHVLHQLPH